MKELQSLGGHFDLDGLVKKIEELENKMQEPTFWDNVNKAQSVTQEAKFLKDRSLRYVRDDHR